MQLHRNAKTTPKGRALIVQRVDVDGWTVVRTAVAFGVSVRTVHKWRARYDSEGVAGLLDRESTPRRSPERTSPPQVAAIVALRTQRLSGTRIAQRLGLPRSTVGVVLRRVGLGRLRSPAPPPAVRYERARPGELLHVDMKALGRIVRPGHRVTGDRRHRIRRVGWDHVHVAIDDASRVAYVEILPTQQIPDAVGFVARAAAWFGAHGVRVERVMTDNGSAYRSAVHALACRALGIRHLRTQPYRPRTNGKAERFIRTLLGGWAYGAIYGSSRERAAALDGWIWTYNHRRPHGALSHKTPMARLSELNNLPGS
jgi:transposase InsO family protein